MNWNALRYGFPIALVVLIVAKWFYAPLLDHGAIPGLPHPSWFAVVFFVLLWASAWAFTPVFCRIAMRLLLLFAKWGIVPVVLGVFIVVFCGWIVDLVSLDVVTAIFPSIPPTHAVDWIDHRLHFAFYGS